MTFMVHFEIEITPVAKGRPRYARRGNFVQTYTPTKTREYEDVIRENSKTAMGLSEPLETPINVLLMFGMQIMLEVIGIMFKVLPTGNIWLKKARCR